MFTDYLWAFIVGGALCAVGQVLIDYTKLTPARILVLYVVAGVVLGAFKIYRPLSTLRERERQFPLQASATLLLRACVRLLKQRDFWELSQADFPLPPQA